MKREVRYTRLICFRASDAVWRALVRAAEKDETNVSEVLRRIISKWMSGEKR